MVSLQDLVPGLLTALGAGLLVAGLVYGIPYLTQAHTTLNATVGPQHQLIVGEGEEVDETFTWRTAMVLPSDPGGFQVRIKLPYEVDVDPPRGNNSRMHLTVSANGESIHEHLQHAGYGGIKQQLPGHDIDTDKLRTGANELTAALQVSHGAELEGTNEIHAGPFIVEAQAVDRDSDGILDPEQPLEGVNTVLIAFMMGTGAFIATTYALQRWQRRGSQRGR